MPSLSERYGSNNLSRLGGVWAGTQSQDGSKPRLRKPSDSSTKDTSVAETGDIVTAIQRPDGTQAPVPTRAGYLIKPKGSSHLIDPESGEPLTTDPMSPTGLRSVFDTVKPISRNGRLIKSVSGFGERDVGADPVAEQKARDKAQADQENARTGQEIDSMRLQKRPHVISRETGRPLPLQSDAEWLADVAKKKAEGAEKERVSIIKADISKADMEIDNPDLKVLTDSERRKLSEDLEAERVNLAVAALDGGTFAGEVDDATIEKLAANPASAPTVAKFKQIRDTLALDAKSVKKTDRLKRHRYDLLRQLHDPEGWKAAKKAEIATATDEDLDDWMATNADTIISQKDEIESQGAQIQSRDNEIIGEINAVVAERNQILKRGATGAELAANAEKLQVAQAKHKAWTQQSEQQRMQLTTKVEMFNERHDMLTLAERQQKDRQEQARQASLKKMAAAPGWGEAAKEIESLYTEGQTKAQALQDKYPEGVPEIASKTLAEEMQAKHEAVIAKTQKQQEQKQAEQTALRTTAGIVANRIKKDREARLSKSDAVDQGILDPKWVVDAAKSLIGIRPDKEAQKAKLTKLQEEMAASKSKIIQDAGLDPANPDHLKQIEDADKLDWSSGSFAVGESTSGKTAAEAEKGLKNFWDTLTRGRSDAKVENARTLSDGSIAVNPLLIQDDKGYATAVEQTDTTPEAKAKAMAQMPQMQKAQARQLIPALLNTPDIFPGESYKSYLARRATEDESFAAMPQEDQAQAYLKEQLDRGYGHRLADKLGNAVIKGGMQLATMTNGTLGMAPVPYLSEYFSEGAADLSMLGAQWDSTVDPRTGTGAAGRIAGETVTMATVMAPLIGASVVTGARVASGALSQTAARGILYGLAGSQTAGQQYADTYGQLREQGAGHWESWMKAAPAAIASGAVTAGLTAMGGMSGAEAMMARQGPEAAKKAILGFWANAVREVPKNALKEIPEEWIDELSSTFVQALVVGQDPTTAVGQFLATSPEFIASVSLMGGMGGAKEAWANRKGQDGPEQDIEAPDAEAAPFVAPSIDAEISKWKPDPKTMPASVLAMMPNPAKGQPAKADPKIAQNSVRAMIAVAKGTPLEKLPMAQLEALGYTRDAKTGAVAQADKRIAPLVYLHKGQPVIRQDGIDWIAGSELTGLESQIGLSETDRISQIDQPPKKVNVKKKGSAVVSTADSLSASDGSTPSPSTNQTPDSNAIPENQGRTPVDQVQGATDAAEGQASLGGVPSGTSGIPGDNAGQAAPLNDGAGVGNAGSNLDRKLPRQLAGAKPRYSFGPKQFELQFDSDYDKAAYITAQETPSKQDAGYLAFAMEASGLTEAQVRAHGRKVRATIKNRAQDAPAGKMMVMAESQTPTVEAGAAEAATSPENDRTPPTKSQAEAGNYKLGPTKVSGMDIRIETVAGVSRNEAEGWPKMAGHYGYFAGTRAGDGDGLDVTIKPQTPLDWDGRVYVVNQNNKDGSFDEYKVMLGYDSQAEAEAAYDASYTPDWTGRGAVEAFTIEDFRRGMMAMTAEEKAKQKPASPGGQSEKEAGGSAGAQSGEGSIPPVTNTSVTDETLQSSEETLPTSGEPAWKQVSDGFKSWLPALTGKDNKSLSGEAKVKILATAKSLVSTLQALDSIVEVRIGAIAGATSGMSMEKRGKRIWVQIDPMKAVQEVATGALDAKTAAEAIRERVTHEIAHLAAEEKLGADRIRDLWNRLPLELQKASHAAYHYAAVQEGRQLPPVDPYLAGHEFITQMLEASRNGEIVSAALKEPFLAKTITDFLREFAQALRDLAKVITDKAVRDVVEADIATVDQLYRQILDQAGLDAKAEAPAETAPPKAEEADEPTATLREYRDVYGKRWFISDSQWQSDKTKIRAFEDEAGTRKSIVHRANIVTAETPGENAALVRAALKEGYRLPAEQPRETESGKGRQQRWNQGWRPYALDDQSGAIVPAWEETDAGPKITDSRNLWAKPQETEAKPAAKKKPKATEPAPAPTPQTSPVGEGALSAEAKAAEAMRQSLAGLFAPTPATEGKDAEHLAAVEAGDTAKAQAMVDEAAKAAGLSDLLFHGTDSEFTEFDPSMAGSRTSGPKTKLAFYFSGSESHALERGSIVMPVFLRYSNPLIIKDLTDTFDAGDIIEKAKENGHDAVIFEKLDDLEDSSKGVYSVALIINGGVANQIKSADPVTRDESGQVIPLSQRFNPESDSILFAPTPATQWEEIDIPDERIPGIMQTTKLVFDAGVRTPEDFAAFMERTFPGGGSRPYVAGIWQIMGGMKRELRTNTVPDWQAIYAEIDKPQSTPAPLSGDTGMQAVVAETVSKAAVEEVDFKALKQRFKQMPDKAFEESVELGITMAAHEIVKRGGTDAEIYQRLLALYERQPKLTAKTSTSKVNQAFSTPAPMAFVASVMGDIRNGKVVAEPSAGNGMLVIERKPNQTILANELDQTRIERLAMQGIEATGEDATTWTPPQAPDRVIANPPFGQLMEEGGSNKVFQTPMGETTSIDQAIVLQSLATMLPDGRAVFIIGGPPPLVRGESARMEYYRKGKAAKFFSYLHENYNLIDHFTVSGDLYEKQGAGWPLDILVIRGAGKSANTLPGLKAPRTINSWEELSNELNRNDDERIKINQLTAEEMRDRVDSVADKLAGLSGGLSGTQGSDRPTRVRAPKANSTANQPDRNSIPRPDSTGSEPTPAAGAGTGGQASPALAGGNVRGTTEGNTSSNEPGGRPLRAGELTEFQASFPSASGVNSAGLLAPVNLIGPMTEAMTRLKSAVGGDLVGYARDKMGYPKGTDISKYFFGDQIDAIAQAIYTSENGGALVIGDQTGTGKGRIAAGLMKYAVKQGMIPVFVTKNQDLFDAMIDDLKDIDSGEIVPVITNNDIKEKSLKNKLNDLGADSGKEVFKQIAETGVLPGSTNVIFTTYDQIKGDDAPGITPRERARFKRDQTAPPGSWRMDALRRVAPNAMFILDESHLAGGQSTTGWRFGELLKEAKNVYYSSATFAKRPDNMGIYFRTNLGRVGGDINGLISLMQAGGVPAMQIGSSMLAQDGQYMRRERSFDGVTFQTHINQSTYERDKELADNYTEGLRAIISVQERMGQAAGAINEILNAFGKSANIPMGNRARLESSNFSAKLHNLVRQYLLAIKADSAAQMAVKAIRDGVKSSDGTIKRHKVIVAVENTMESIIENLQASGLPLTFNGVLQMYLNQMKSIKVSGGAYGREAKYFEIKDNPPKEFANTDDSQLRRMLVIQSMNPETGEAAFEVNQDVANEMIRRAMVGVFNEAKGIIEYINLADMPLSPIDAMRQAVEREGIRTGEMTGRSTGIDQNGEPYQRSAAEVRGKLQAKDDFNNADLDFLVINKSGSTGVSMHASEKFKDKRPRLMMIVQANLDINEFMQTIGRIHRAGQVELPSYVSLQTALPAENRPAAILGRKMSMLNANTTSNADSELSQAEIADIFNQYGDEVVHGYLARNPGLVKLVSQSWAKLTDGGALKPLTDFTDEETGGHGYLARSVTGHLAILPVDEQEAFWETVTADYKAMIDYLDQIGKNELRASALDMKAETVSSVEFTQGTDDGSVFSRSSFLETVNAKLGKRPLEVDEAIKMADEARVNADTRQDMFIERANALIDEMDAKKAISARNWEERRQEWINTQQEQRDAISNAIGLIGSFGTYEREDGSEGYAFIEDVTLNSNSPNAPSSQIAIVRVNDSQDRMKIPVSQIAAFFTPVSMSDYNRERIARQGWERSWSFGNQQYIVTGNLLAALQEITSRDIRPRVVSYTKSDGSQQMGVMLSKGAALEISRSRQTSTAVADADAMLALVRSGYTIRNTSGTVSIAGRDGSYYLYVPSARSTGGKYWRDPALLRITGEFVEPSRGDSNFAATMEGDALKKAFDYLVKTQGERFVRPSDGGDSSNQGPSAPTPASGDSGAGESVSDTEIEQMLKDMMADWNNAAEARESMLGAIDSLPVSAEELAELRARKERQQAEGADSIGVPYLANPGKSKAVRDQIDVVQYARAKYNAERKSDDQVIDAAHAAIEADAAGVEQALLDKVQAGENYEPEDHAAAKILINILYRRAIIDGSAETKRRADTLQWYYGEAGTQWSQAGRIRRDPQKKPAERFRQFFHAIARTPPAKVRADIAAAYSPMAKARRIRDLQDSLATADAKAQEMIKREIERERQMKDQLELLDEYEAQNEAHIRKVLSRNGGLSQEDIILDPSDRLDMHEALLGLPDVREAFAAMSKPENTAIRMAMRGFSPSEIASRTALAPDAINKLTENFRNAILKKSLSSHIKQGGTFGNLLEAGARMMKRFTGAPGTAGNYAMLAAQGLVTHDQAIVQEVDRILNFAFLPARVRQNRADSMEAVVVNTAQGQKVRLKVPFDPTDMRQMFRIGRELAARESTVFDKAYEYWIMGILSGPQTQVVNILGNAGNAAWHFTVQRAAELLVNTAIGDKDAAQWGEIPHVVRGFWNGIAPALNQMALAWDTEADMTRNEFLDEPLNLDFLDGDTDKVGGSKPSIVGWKLGKTNVGRVIRFSGRVLRAMDALFKTLILHGEAAAWAFRHAKAAGYTGAALEAEIASELSIMGSDAWKRAMETAEDLTFQSTNWATTTAEWVTLGRAPTQAAIKSIAAAQKAGDYQTAASLKTTLAVMKFTSGILRFIFPFKRTPANILRTGVRKAGGSALAMLWNAKSGLYSMKNGKSFIEGYPKALMVKDMSETALATLAWLALMGVTEGDDDDDKKEWLWIGNRPYGVASEGERESVKRQYGGPNTLIVRDKQGNEIMRQPFGRFEPFGTTLGIIIDAMRETKEVGRRRALGENVGIGEIGSSVVSHLMAQAEDKTFLQGFSSLMKMQEEIRSGRTTLGDSSMKFVMQGMVPNLFRQSIRGSDDLVREYRGADWSYLAAAMPSGASPKIDSTGREVKKEGSLLTRLLLPTATNTGKVPDPTLMRFNQQNPSDRFDPTPRKARDMYVYRPGTRRGDPDRKLPLTDRADQTALEKLAGTIYAAKAQRIEAGLSTLQRKSPNEEVKKQYQKAREEAIVTARTSLPLTGRLKAK